MRNSSPNSSPAVLPVDGARGLHQPDLEQLPRVVPLVDRVADVETFVALQPDQIGLEAGREDPGHFGLADTGFAFEEQRPLQLERQVDGRREAAVGDVELPLEKRLNGVDGRQGQGRDRKLQSTFGIRNSSRTTRHSYHCHANRNIPAASCAAASARLTQTGAVTRRYSADA